MEKYITYRESDIDGNFRYFICQKEHPHFVGEIVTVPKKMFIESTPISGYNLWICFSWTLRGAMIPSYKNVEDMMRITMEDMALWFLDKRIKNDEKKYTKFKIK